MPCAAAADRTIGSIFLTACCIKNNHIALAGGVAAALQKALRNRREEQPIEIEVRTLAELEEALANGAESILLDNMKVEDVRQAVHARVRPFPACSGGGFRRHSAGECSRLRRNRCRLHFCRSADAFAPGSGLEHADRSRISFKTNSRGLLPAGMVFP